ncbi:unnamed protein product [Xylocopa violacea]|uniref:Uncharacterized protein n=1 Tax=Xylocopa violacea TaxID=135666 RepID=A0ABP1NRQ1_XYLVO
MTSAISYDRSRYLHSVSKTPTEHNHKGNPILFVNFTVQAVMGYHDVPKIMIAATERRLTPTFPYLKKGTKIQKNLISAQLASTNRMESNGGKNDSFILYLIMKAAATFRTFGYLHNAIIVNKLPEHQFPRRGTALRSKLSAQFAVHDAKRKSRYCFETISSTKSESAG